MSQDWPASPSLIVLGAGMAGLACALHAQVSGVSALIFERAAAAGGLARTLYHEGHAFDSGAHRVHARDPAFVAALCALGVPLLPVATPNRVQLAEGTMPFPPGWRDCLRGLRPREVLGMVRTWGGDLRPSGPPHGDFAAFARGRFGARLSNQVLLPYSQKLWGLPPAELHPRVATRRLQGWHLGELLRSLPRGGQRPHLDGDFLYPRHGIGSIAQAMVDRLPAGALVLGRAVQRLEVADGRVVRLHFETGAPFDLPPKATVISTLPLPRLVAALGPALPSSVGEQAAELRFRNLRLVFLRLARPQVSGHGTLYFPAPEVCFTRLSEPRNRSVAMAPSGETGLLAEVPCFEGDELDHLDDVTLEGQVLADAAAAGVLQRHWVRSCAHHRLNDAYPVHSLRAESASAAVHAALPAITNLRVVGRAGEFRYGHLHEQYSRARALVALLVPGAGAGFGGHGPSSGRIV